MDLPFANDRATLFFDAVMSKAVLIEIKRGRQRSCARKFTDAHAALNWCVSERVHFVLFWPSAAQGN
jgi:hypothetical protein